jgi:hypothetical protein
MRKVWPNFDINSMLAQNGGPVTVKSLFVREANTTKEIVEATRNNAIVTAVQKASVLFGPTQALTIRDLNGNDMGYIYNVMTETSNASINAWNEMGVGSFIVAPSTVIAIYGVGISLVPDGTNPRIPITGIRIVVEGSLVVQWNIQSLDLIGSACGTSPMAQKSGISLAPIIAAEGIVVTTYEYTRAANIAYDLVWLGVIVEKQGVTLKP